MRIPSRSKGLLACELFVTRGADGGDGELLGELLVNELAPRPHNSYHESERACVTSQFEQAIRAVCDLPLGDVDVVQPAAIANLLGDLWLDAEGKPREVCFDRALAVPGVRLHLYEKLKPRRGRKMGHLSAVGATPTEAVERVLRAKGRTLGWVLTHPSWYEEIESAGARRAPWTQELQRPVDQARAAVAAGLQKMPAEAEGR